MAKERTLDIFATLRAMDMGAMDYYAGAPDSARKELDAFIGFPALRWMSSAKDDRDHADALLMVDAMANAGYFGFGRHKELQFKMLCLAGLRNGRLRHTWIAGPKARRSGKVRAALRRHDPLMKDDECDLWVELNGESGLLQLGSALGMQKDELKEMMAEFEAARKQEV